MNIFRLGQMVRLVRGQDHLDYAEMATIGEVGQIIGAGEWFPEDYAGSYDWVVSFPSYGCLCCYAWQLEPEFKQEQELMDGLRETVK